MEQRPTHIFRQETKHSMLRRCNNWDYKKRGIYMLTLVTAERKPLLGTLREDNTRAYIELTPIGQMVANEAENIPAHYPQIRILCKQVMPDHLHLLLFVQEALPVHLGIIMRGFKQGTEQGYSRLKAANTEHLTAGAEYLTANPERLTTGTEHLTAGIAYARISQQGLSCARRFQRREDTLVAADLREADARPVLWQNGYHDRILFHAGQLDNMIAYIHANPRRLALKRANPELFRIHQQTMIAGTPCTTLGNIFLAEYPMRTMVQCSRRLTQSEIDAKRDACLSEAANGVVHISAAISEGEKQICRALREAGNPLVIILTEGFPSPDSPHYRFYKPQGVYFEACAAGRLLLVEPETAYYDRPEVEAKVYAKTGILDLPHDAKRYRFLALNALAEKTATI